MSEKEIIKTKIDLNKTILVASVGAMIATGIAYYSNPLGSYANIFLSSAFFFGIAGIISFIAYIIRTTEYVKERAASI